ncbi:hypothetical protein [Coraliomargarita parva]|uniref:hypothetical protein n=1 Tax=Coraliomargarita parva TaxID=3014050 RepID=UPI0022B3FAA6|nr:hypothetical protein [Coraliomargarita parva]
MVKNNQKEVREALVEVRRSYRTLYSYQKMVLDLVKHMSSRMEMHFINSYPWFSASPPSRNSTWPLDRWAWDWLGMYNYVYYFRSGESENTTDLYFFLFSDTGYWDSDFKTDEAQRLQPEKFKSVDSSDTMLLLGTATGGDDARVDPSDIEFCNPDLQVHPEGNITKLFQLFELSELRNSELADQKLFGFIKRCKEYGVELPVKETNLIN